MYKMYDEMHVEVKHHLRGGEGDPVTRQIFSPEELGGRAEMFNIMTLQPGESVGVHDHVTNGEAYLVLSGSVTVTDEGIAIVGFHIRQHRVDGRPAHFRGRRIICINRHDRTSFAPQSSKLRVSFVLKSL